MINKDKLEKKRFGFLGRLHPRKNVEKIIYAYSLLNDKPHNIELNIIGDGDSEYVNFLKSEVARLKLTNVNFCGFISGQKKYDLLSSLSLLLVPSDF